MEKSEQEELQEMLKALADDSRLLLLQVLHGHEYMAGDLAARVGLSDPTVSHHLAKLREAGLVLLRMDGNKRYYRLDDKGLAKFKRLVNQIEQMPIEPPVPDNSWIDALGWSTEDSEVLRAYTKNGKLVQVPSVKLHKKLMVIMRWLATLFEPDRIYTEREVTDIIKQVSTDPVGLRRDLIDYGFLRRERGGAKYWLTPHDEEVKSQ